MLENDKIKKTIVLVGGGTGGHLFPAIAVGQDLCKQYNVILLTDRRCVQYLHKSYPFIIDVLNITKPVSKIYGKVLFAVQNISIFFQLLYKFLKLKPTLVVGFGSYVSFLPLLVAKILGIKIMLHEQNAHIGYVNKLFINCADKVMLSFDSTKGADQNQRNNIVVTGNPIRHEITNYRNTEINYDSDPFTILVVGGSQGSVFLNQVVSQALLLIKTEYQNVLNQLKNTYSVSRTELSKIIVFHQAHENYHEELDKIYSELDLKYSINSFFSNLPEIYSKSHLVISRSGASTISELIELSKPSILIPLPNSAHNHQVYNAQIINNAKGGVCFEQFNLSPMKLAFTILARILDRSILQNESKNLSVLQNDGLAKIRNTIIQSCLR